MIKAFILLVALIVWWSYVLWLAVRAHLTTCEICGIAREGDMCAECGACAGCCPMWMGGTLNGS